MFAGHLGMGLAIARAERRVNAGVFVAAALGLDLLLWPLVLLGWESVAIPADFARTHQPEFVFPYSHSLAASAGWSVAAAASTWALAARLGGSRGRAAALVAAAVFSHWLLDVLVHRPEMPLAGAASPALGAGLWNHMPLALAVEAAIVVVGLWLFVAGSGLARGRRIGIAALSLGVLAFTALGMTVAPAPPSVLAMAFSSWLTIVGVCAAVGWLARAPGATAAGRGPLRR